MAAISHPEIATVAAERPQLERTFAMNVVSTGFGVITVGLIYLVILFLRAGDEFRASALVPVFATITAIFAGLGTVSLVWSGARRHAWVWLVFALPAVLFLLMNATYLAYDITHPTFAEMFVRSLLLLAGGLAIILGSVAAFFEVRRGAPMWARTGPIGWGSMAVIGALVGAAVTSIGCGLGDGRRDRGGSGANCQWGPEPREERLQRSRPRDAWRRGPRVVHREQGSVPALLRYRQP